MFYNLCILNAQAFPVIAIYFIKLHAYLCQMTYIKILNKIFHEAEDKSYNSRMDKYVVRYLYIKKNIGNEFTRMQNKMLGIWRVELLNQKIHILKKIFLYDYNPIKNKISLVINIRSRSGGL